MKATTVVVGAGHAGLAMSRCLTERSIDHVLLERGEVANTWKTERWDSLRLLTPNWQSRLPDYRYEGEDPDGYRDVPELVEFLDHYAATISAPVEAHTRVTSVRSNDHGYVIATDRGEWRSRTVVLASGACNIPVVPPLAGDFPPSIRMLTPSRYSSPDDLDEGGVLVVGAASTGVQLAEEIHRSGRPVTVAVGEHVRLPRIYRGKDILWWMDTAGVMDDPYDEEENLDRARSLPSMQLTGSPERRTTDLNSLTDIGVRLVGRLVGIRDHTALFSGSLKNVCALADLKMNRLLDRIDEWAEEAEEAGELEDVAPVERFDDTWVEESPPLQLDLGAERIETVLWATGFRPDHSWLEVPVFDRKGRIRHDGGVVEDAPGMYVMGMQFLRRRKSALIDGAGDDARDLSAHLAGYLDNSLSRSVGS